MSRRGPAAGCPRRRGPAATCSPRRDPVTARAPRRDPVAGYSPRLASLFERYLRRYLAAHFNAIRVAGAIAGAVAGPVPAFDPTVPTVFYANHAAWWDPLVLFFALRPTGAMLFAPFDAAALGRYRFFARLGGFPVEPGTHRGAAAFLAQAGHVLASPGRLLCVTAQGRFADPRERPLRLARGVAHLLARGIARRAVPVALEYPFWQEAKPEALLRFGTPVTAPAADPGIRPRARMDTVHTRLERALEGVLDALATDAIARDEAAFQTLLRGRRRGAGGWYDAWLWLRDRSFDVAHGTLNR